MSDVVREFNRLRVDGSDGWTDCSIRRTLSNPIYFGFDVYNRTRNEWDGEAFKRKTFTNPQRDWIVQTVPAPSRVGSSDVHGHAAQASRERRAPAAQPFRGK